MKGGHEKFARNTSVLKQYKTQEDVICNQVLWMALITHLGKTERTGTLKADKVFVIAPQVSPPNPVLTLATQTSLHSWAEVIRD